MLKFNRSLHVIMLISFLNPTCQLNEIESTTFRDELITTEHIQPMNSPDCPVESVLNIQPCFHCFENDCSKMRLNISWHDLNATIESISVDSTLSEGGCTFSFPTPINSNNSSGFILVPEPELEYPNFEIKENCEYNIRMVTLNNSLGCNNYYYHYQYSLSSGTTSLIGSALRDSDSIYTPAVVNVSVVSFNDNGIIRLNISWDEIMTHINPDPAQLTVEIYNVTCSEFHYVQDNAKNYVIKPDPIMLNPLYKAYPGCQYKIEFRSHDGIHNTRNNYTYTVPECVGSACTCPDYNPTPELKMFRWESDEDFIIRWDPGPSTINGLNQTIHLDHCDVYPHTTNFEIVNISASENWTRIRVDGKPNENYTFIGIFTNNFGCSGNVSHYFQMPTTVVPMRQYNTNNTIRIIITGLILILIGFIVWRWRKLFVKILLKMLPKRYRTTFEAPSIPMMHNQDQPFIFLMRNNILYTPVEFQNGSFDDYEISRNKIEIIEEIGRGAFGFVYSAMAHDIEKGKSYTMVAIKTLGDHATRENLDDFIAEIALFKKIGQHPNIVRLLKCCTRDEPYMMIMEYVPCGDLKKYLVELRQQWIIKKNTQRFFPDNSDGAYITPDPESPTSPSSPTSSQFPITPETGLTNVESQSPTISPYTLEKILDHKELQSFALQIAKGMAHLESISIMHRDLAARNILINERKQLKISDFGLSRQGPYVNHRSRKLPLRWMALEAIVNQEYDSKSDVWSFGIVLWEIATLGAFPYEDVPDSFVLGYLKLGKRLKKPEICTDSIYEMMLQCWAQNSEERPTFQQLVDVLDDTKRKVYVDFGQLNPCYIFPPSDLYST